MFLSSINSLLSDSAGISLLQNAPLQSPQACEQGNSFFLHLHCRVLHVFFDDILQLHRMTSRSSFGATGESVIVGTSNSSTLFHPHSVGCNPVSIVSMMVLSVRSRHAIMIIIIMVNNFMHAMNGNE